MSKLELASNGRVTCIRLDGKNLGRGVKSVKFSHGESDITLGLSIDLTRFSFMPDGYFDEFVRKLDQEIPPADGIGGRSE